MNFGKMTYNLERMK